MGHPSAQRQLPQPCGTGVKGQPGGQLDTGTGQETGRQEAVAVSQNSVGPQSPSWWQRPQPDGSQFARQLPGKGLEAATSAQGAVPKSQ